ncbi:MAG: AAA family ATPase [Burkholderiaceae bacterium]|nr:AAA family ATPase [Burkholderiaceae bacterium]
MSAAVQDLARAAAALPAVRLLRGDAVALEPVRWAWRGFLPLGMLTILGGAPGCGKTTIALSLAAIITRAGPWPDGSRCAAVGDVIVWSGEDAPTVTAARLRAAGADMTRVHFVDGITGGEGEPFDPGRDMALLEATAERLAAPRLLILDPIVSAVTGDSHKGAEVRRSLQPVVELAQRLGCAVLGITHFSKGTSGRDPVERVTGSIAFAALARLVLVAAKVKPEPGDEAEPRRVLLRAKSNVSADDGGFAYALERVEVAPEVEGQRVRWLEALDGTARELLAEAEADPARDEVGDDVALFLRGVLADGPVAAKAVFADAAGAGYSRDQVQRTARRMGVDRRKLGMSGGWVWALPAPEGGTEDGEDRSHHSVPPSPPSAPSSAAADDVEVF